MEILMFGGPILVGFVLGYFFALPVLGIITAISGALTLYVFKDFKGSGLAGAAMLIFAFVVSLGNISMWVTHYFVSNQIWFGEFVHTYIFR